MSGYFSAEIVLLLMPWPPLAIVVLIGRALEKLSPIDPNLSPGEKLLDYKFAAANTVIGQLLFPLTGVISALVINAAGGGWISLPTGGASWILSGAAVILVYDLFRYWTHRLYHAVPVLWAMHSFHHSAEALTVVTGARQYWLESAINSALFPVAAIIFQVPPLIGLLVPVIYFVPDGCAHLNYRIDLGRFVSWINNPQWHRIHHSTSPEHLNKNFCSLLPLMDLLFGTAWVPAPGEYPVAGLTPRECPTFWEGLAWPIRKLLFQRPAGTPKAAAGFR